MTNDYSLSDVASVVRNTDVTNLIEQTKKRKEKLYQIV